MLDSIREANELAGAAVEGGLEVFDTAYEEGVSANLCEAVDRMFVDGYFSAIELRPRLSPALVSRVRPMVRLDSASVPVFKDAAVRLRKLSKQPQATTVTGRVTDLHRSSPATDESVSVTSLVDGKKRTVRMKLSATQYGEAIRAHDKTLPVIARGNLAKRGNRFWLEGDVSFKVPDDETLFEGG